MLLVKNTFALNYSNTKTLQLKKMQGNLISRSFEASQDYGVFDADGILSLTLHEDWHPLQAVNTRSIVGRIKMAAGKSPIKHCHVTDIIARQLLT